MTTQLTEDEATVTATQTGLKIVKLTAENIKRIKAVEITPEGNTVVIAGRNAQGKTSVLDSIWFALGGGAAQKSTVRPIRDGEHTASVTLDLGELKVARTWKGDKTTLVVTSADGAKYASPQAMLDNLIGKLSFDPLAFSNLPDKEQLAALLQLVDLPFVPAELDAKRRRIFDERTTINRDAKQLEGQLAGIPKPPAGVPAEEVSVADVLAEYQQAQDKARQQETDKRALQYARNRAAEIVEERERLIREHEQRLAKLNAELEQIDDERTRLSGLVAGHEPIDLDSYTHRLNDIEGTNASVRAAKEHGRISELLGQTKAAANELTDQLAEIDERKATAIREAKMPIDGLGFDEDGVTYQGVPFRQCSGAERLRVSLAMAMAMNPRIRVIRITDGSLLDSSNMALIEEMARDMDFQVWIEVVSESGDLGVVIEDGLVAS